MTTILPKHTYKCSRAFYAKKFNRSLPTISKWMIQEAPLDDDIKMVGFIEERNSYITGGTKPPLPPIEPHPSAGETAEKREEMPIRGAPAPTANRGGGAQGRSEVTLKAERAAVDLEIARHKLSVLKGETIDRTKIQEAGILIGSILDAELTAIEQEIPGVCAGLSEIELKTKLPSFFIRLRKNLKEKLLEHTDAASQPAD